MRTAPDSHPPQDPTQPGAGSAPTSRDKIEDLAFNLWQDMNGAEFYVLMAYKHGADDHFRSAVARLRSAVARIDVALRQKRDDTIDGQDEADDTPDFRALPWQPSPEDFALEGADLAVMRRKEDGE